MPDYRPINDLLEIIGDYEMELVGSTAILGQGADIDIAVKMFDTETPIHTQTLRDVVASLSHAGCTTSGGAHYEVINLTADDQFTSMRRGDYNLLLCFNERSWNRFTKGRDFCILLQDLGVSMTDKAVRVAIHGMANHGDIALVRADLARLPARQPVRADTAANRAEGIGELVMNRATALLGMQLPRGRWLPMGNPRQLPAQVNALHFPTGAHGDLVIMDDLQHD